MVKVPNTISDSKWSELAKKRAKAEPNIFSKEATRLRKLSGAQKSKANQS